MSRHRRNAVAVITGLAVAVPLVSHLELGAVERASRPAHQAAAQRSSSQAGYGPGDVPEALQPAVQRAEAGLLALQGSLLRRLQDATQDGPASALDVCHVEAGAIRDRVVREQGITIGRTSHALRNATNVPPAWAAALVAESAGKTAREYRQRVFDLGETVGVIRPIPTGVLCTNCHGPLESLGADVRAALKQRYPQDQAVGFREGDLRGWIWAEVPKQTAR